MNYLFRHSKSIEHLSLLIKILTNEFINKTNWPYIEKGGYFSVVLEEILSHDVQKKTTTIGIISESDDDSDLNKICQNLLILLR